MVHSPSWEANCFAASQGIPRISRNLKVHYRTHKRPPPVCILGQPNPVHISKSHLLDIRHNIIHPSTPRSPQWSFSLRLPYQDPTHPSPHSEAPHAQRSYIDMIKNRTIISIGVGKEDPRGIQSFGYCRQHQAPADLIQRKKSLRCRKNCRRGVLRMGRDSV